MQQKTFWQINRAGNLDRLTLKTEPAADLKPGLVRVKIRHVGLNFADIFACLGLYSASPQGAFTPGLEFSGVVISGNNRFTEGTEVYGMSRFGAYTDLIDIDPDYLTEIPESMSPEQAAAYPVQTLTAWYALVNQGAITENSSVLIHSAAGGTGQQAVKIARHFKATITATIGTANTDQKIDFLMRNYKFTEENIIVRNKKTFYQQITDNESRQFDIILDAVAGDYFKPGFNALAPGGRYVLYGAASFMTTSSKPSWLRIIPLFIRRPRLDPLDMISDNKSLMAFNLIWLYHQKNKMRQMLDQISATDITAPEIDQVFDFKQAPQALKALQRGSNSGKILLRVS